MGSKLRVSPVLWADGCSPGPLRVCVWSLDVYGQMGLSLWSGFLTESPVGLIPQE